jgi:hypothetical protein
MYLIVKKLNPANRRKPAQMFNKPAKAEYKAPAKLISMRAVIKYSIELTFMLDTTSN